MDIGVRGKFLDVSFLFLLRVLRIKIQQQFLSAALPAPPHPCILMCRFFLQKNDLGHKEPVTEFLPQFILA